MISYSVARYPTYLPCPVDIYIRTAPNIVAAGTRSRNITGIFIEVGGDDGLSAVYPGITYVPSPMLNHVSSNIGKFPALRTITLVMKHLSEVHKRALHSISWQDAARIPVHPVSYGLKKIWTSQEQDQICALRGMMLQLDWTSSDETIDSKRLVSDHWDRLASKAFSQPSRVLPLSEATLSLQMFCTG